MKYEHSCGFILFRLNNGIKEYLVVKDRNNNYSFVKGHTEENETLLDCAYREVYEEISIKHINIINNYKYDMEYLIKDDLTKKVTLFLGQTSDLAIINDGEIKEILYLPYDKAYNLITHKEYKDALELANRY